MDERGRLALAGTFDASDDVNATPIHIQPRAVIAAWMVPALLSTAQRWASGALSGESISLWRLVLTEWPGWCLWAALTPVVFTVAHHFRFRAGHRMLSSLAHLGMLASCLCLHAIVTSGAARIIGDSSAMSSFPRYVAISAISWLPSTFILYAATVGAAFWMQAIQRAKLRERQGAAMSIQLARAELDSLRSQLHPHFLFNTLNTIAVLIREHETELSARLVTRLGDLLRHVLRGARAHETTLNDEVSLISAYLEIEQIRFGDRLEVRWAVPSELRNAIVPSLVLQPLLENALRHAIARRTENGIVEVGAQRNEGLLTLWIDDNGADPAHGENSTVSGEDPRGMGLTNTRERLARLYPGASSLHLLARATGGSRAEVRVPYRVEPRS